MKKQDLEGFKGWLLLYVIIHLLGTISIIGAFFIYTFPNYSQYLSYGAKGIRLFVLSGIVAFLGVYSLFYLLRKSQKAPALVIFLLWVVAITNILHATVFRTIFVLDRFIGIIAQFVWAIVFTFYFIRSKRVKNTFKTSHKIH